MYEEIQSTAKHPWFKYGVLTTLFLLALFLALQSLTLIKAYPSVGGGMPAAHTIVASGEGEIFAVPDIASFTFSVVEERQNAEEAQSAVAGKGNAVLEYLKGEGIKETDIQTTSYNVYPRYEFLNTQGISIPRGERQLAGFEARHSIRVKVRDTNKAGELLAGVGSRGVSDISGLQFTIDDEDTLKAQARGLAIFDAKEKAQKLADDLDVRLLRVVSFSESGGDFFRTASLEAHALGGAIDSAVPPPQLPTGENRIVSNVSIVYEIR